MAKNTKKKNMEKHACNYLSSDWGNKKYRVPKCNRESDSCLYLWCLSRNHLDNNSKWMREFKIPYLTCYRFSTNTENINSAKNKKTHRFNVIWLMWLTFTCRESSLIFTRKNCTVYMMKPKYIHKKFTSLGLNSSHARFTNLKVFLFSSYASNKIESGRSPYIQVTEHN